MSPSESLPVVGCADMSELETTSSSGSDVAQRSFKSASSRSLVPSAPLYVERDNMIYTVLTMLEVKRGAVEKLPVDETVHITLMINTQGAHHPPVPALKGLAADLHAKYASGKILLFPVHKDNVVLRNSLKGAAHGVVFGFLESKNDILDSVNAAEVIELVKDVKEPVRTHRAKLKSIPGATPPGGSFASGARVHIASRRIASGKKTGSDTLVHTPWYPEGVPHDAVSLDDELLDFYDFMTLKSKEMSARLELRTSLQSIISLVLPGATVKQTGSFAYGTMLACSVADLVVEGVPQDAMAAVRCEIEDRGVTVTLESETEHTQAYHLILPNGKARLVLDTRPVSPLRRAATLVNKWLGEVPLARPIICLLRHVLGQCKYVNNDGGLSGYLLTLMVVGCCRNIVGGMDAAVTPGGAVLHVLRLLGKFEHNVCSLDPNTGEFTAKLHPEHDISVLDPLDSVSNAAEKCKNFMHIKIQLSYILSALEGWHLKLAAKKSYKGRTPLSSIMSHVPLWPRQKELAARAKEVGHRFE